MDPLLMDTSEGPARFLPENLVRPNPGMMGVITTLADFAIITFAVPPSALARLLPPDFEPDVFTLKDGIKAAFISAVPFRDLDFRFSACPWPKFAFGQTNYRAYAKYKGKRIVWFFGTSLATPFVMIPRHLWQLPWHHAEMKFDTRWEGEVCLSYKLNTRAEWGNAEVILEGTDRPVGCLDGFADNEETAVVLTHPLAGYFNRRDGKLGSYSVWHDKLSMTEGIAHKANFQVFNELGLTTPDSIPHSVMLQRATEFTILLPPRRV